LSNYDLKQPGLCDPNLKVADVYLHTNLLTDQDQWWIYKDDQWNDITTEYLAGKSIFHPTFSPPIVLSKTDAGGEPTYVKEATHNLKAAFRQAMKQKEKEKRITALAKTP
jgi:hypothetical protein